MKRLLATATLIALAISVIPNSYAATPKAGAKCSKAGATSTYVGKKFTCVKSGNKLVWNKGVAVAKPTPKPLLQTIPNAPTPVVEKINNSTYLVTIPTTTGFDQSSMLLKIFFTSGAGTCKGEQAVTTLPYSALCSHL